MSDNHKNEPRNVAYSKEVAEYYQDKDHSWLDRDSNKIFAGMFQKDLFIFAMALGKNREMKKGIKPNNKQSNVSVNAMDDKQKWVLLSIGISEQQDILCLKDEGPLYELAEEYANEGIEILKSHIDKYGVNYPKQLELELKEILGII